jgi:4-amino-4-deoxy-L-arabinose transferase-like glycosyltransferase
VRNINKREQMTVISQNHSEPQHLIARRALVGALLAITLLVAVFLRTYELDRIPPGPYYDEAAATILTADVASGRSLPIFITAYTGHEVLFYYLAAVVMRLMGISVLALRLTSALVGVATVLLTYLLARELFDDEPVIESYWLGLFAAALAATSFWHVSASRYGLRAITLPLVQSLMLLALWRGLRLNSWKWIVAAGVFCGLIAYTYLSSRIVPVALAILLLLIFIAERRRWRLRLMQLGSLALVALIVFAPLGVFFLTHPETFSVRMNQLSILEGGDGTWQTVALRNTLRALQVFTWRGDPDARLNLPDLPMFQWLAPAFYLGLIALVWRLARASGFLGRVRYAMLVIWPLVMLAPTILSDPMQVPHSLRAIGVMPLAFFIPALGLVAVLSVLQRYIHSQRRMMALTSTAFLVTLAVSAVVTFQDYFVRWASQPKLYYSNDSDLADMARYLNSLPDDGRTLYVSAPDYRHPTVAALARNYSQMKWVQGGEAFVFSPEPSVYAWSHLALPDDWWLARYFPPESRIAQQLAPDGTLAYIVHSLDQPPVISSTYPLHINFGGVIEAIGYDVLRDRPSGGRTDAAIYWRILRQPDRGDYSGFITLSDAWGMNWGQGGWFAYPSEQWKPGEVVAERVRVQTDDGTPPGNTYTLKLGWWSASNGQRLPVIDSQGSYAGTTVAISPITVTRRIRALDVNALNISHRLNADFGGLKLLGFDQWPSSLRQGESEFLTLYWQAETVPLPDRQVTLQLRAPDQSIRVLSRSGPVHGTYPTSQWEAGEFVADRLAFRVSPDTQPGTYTLEAQVDGLPVQPLGQFDVQAIARTWTLPTTQHPMSVTLGSQVALVGYDAESPIPNLKSQQVELRLYWQSLHEMDENYTVFVHLVDSNGSVRSQKDNAPVNDTYPTSLWQPGEFVADAYILQLPPDLPPGDYSVEVGMYLAETGARLQVAGNGDHVALGKIHIP